MAHLSDDEAVAKMGHPIVVVLSDMGHRAEDVGHPATVLTRAVNFKGTAALDYC
jgi:hypothetical protein